MAHELIEELIEESYLLSLSEPEIRLYLTNFIEACETVVNERLNSTNDLRTIGIKVAILRARFLVHKHSIPAVQHDQINKQTWEDTQSIAGLVLETKRSIKKLFDSIDPILMEEVEYTVKNRQNTDVPSVHSDFMNQWPSLLYRLGYVGLYLLIFEMLITYIAY